MMTRCAPTAVVLVLAAALLGGAAAAQDEPCLTGAARLTDARDLGRLREAIEAACPCAAFTGAPGLNRRAYRRCAAAARDAALTAGGLRAACSASATRDYRDTTCGAPGQVACGRVAPRSRRPVSCRIKAAARCIDRSRFSEQACLAETHCADVVTETAGTCVRQPLDAYAPGWSTIHADAANTDYAPVAGAADVSLAWQRNMGGSINVGATTDPHGRIYLTTSNPAGCHLHALDGATGATVWCTDRVDRLAVVSSPLLDGDGRLFIADGTAMRAFDLDGGLLWETPIVGVPLSAQFTASGRLLFMTHIGRVYVLRRETGTPLLPPLELIPGATFDPADGLLACARGTEACPAANTLAIDRPSGRFYFTFWAPGAPQASLRAMQFSDDPTATLTALWSTDALPGGSASSPVLNADGTRLYVNDNVDGVHALEAATGAGIWSFPIGFASGGSPSLAPTGIFMPAGGGASPLLALRDVGPAAELLWRLDDQINRGIATQTAGDKVYATVNAGGFVNDLVVVDAATGAELDREPLPGNSIFTVGTTVGPDGTVYVPSIVGGLYAFRPATP